MKTKLLILSFLLITGMVWGQKQRIGINGSFQGNYAFSVEAFTEFDNRTKYQRTEFLVTNNSGDDVEVQIETAITYTCERVENGFMALTGGQTLRLKPGEGKKTGTWLKETMDEKCVTIESDGRKNTIVGITYSGVVLKNNSAKSNPKTEKGSEIEDNTKTEGNAAKGEMNTDLQKGSMSEVDEDFGNEITTNSDRGGDNKEAYKEYERQKEAEERKRKEEEQKQVRQAEYNLWKGEQMQRQREFEAAAMEETFNMLMLLGGFIYNGMGNVPPENVFKNHEPSVKFYAGFDLGFSFTNMPLIFSSNHTTMILGEYINTKENIPVSAYTVNLGGAVKLGLEHNNFNFNAFFAPKAGVSPIFDGSNLSILNAGAQASLGANWIKLFGEYRIGTHNYSRSSTDAEESGKGKMLANFNRLTYGLKFTLNPKKFVRDHLFIGLMKENIKIDNNSVMFDPNLNTFLTNTKSKDLTGYTIQWKKDHNFNFYINIFPDYWYAGEQNKDSGRYSSEFIKGKTDIYIEIGFVRSWDFFL